MELKIIIMVAKLRSLLLAVLLWKARYSVGVVNYCGPPPDPVEMFNMSIEIRTGAQDEKSSWKTNDTVTYRIKLNKGFSYSEYNMSHIESTIACLNNGSWERRDDLVLANLAFMRKSGSTKSLSKGEHPTRAVDGNMSTFLSLRPTDSSTGSENWWVELGDLYWVQKVSLNTTHQLVDNSKVGVSLHETGTQKPGTYCQLSNDSVLNFDCSKKYVLTNKVFVHTTLNVNLTNVAVYGVSQRMKICNYHNCAQDERTCLDLVTRACAYFHESPQNERDQLSSNCNITYSDNVECNCFEESEEPCYCVNGVEYGDCRSKRKALHVEIVIDNFNPTEGETATLHCSARGGRPNEYVYTWTSRPKYDDINYNSHINQSQYLVIQNLEYTDSAYYNCSAENVAGVTQSKEAAIIVQYGPIPVIPGLKHVVHASPNEEVTLMLDFYAFPAVTSAECYAKSNLISSKDSDSIPQKLSEIFEIPPVGSDKYHVHFKHRLHPSKQVDSFSCIVKNSINETEVNIEVNQNPKNANFLYTSFSKITAVSAQLTWRPNKPVSRPFDVYRQLYGSNETLQIVKRGMSHPNEGRNYTLQLGGLEPNSLYAIHVSNNNVSKMSLLATRGLPVPPEHMYFHPNGYSLKVQWDSVEGDYDTSFIEFCKDGNSGSCKLQLVGKRNELVVPAILTDVRYTFKLYIYQENVLVATSKSFNFTLTKGTDKKSPVKADKTVVASSFLGALLLLALICVVVGLLYAKRKMLMSKVCHADDIKLIPTSSTEDANSSITQSVNSANTGAEDVVQVENILSGYSGCAIESDMKKDS